MTFPYNDHSPPNKDKEVALGQATEVHDLVCREQCASFQLMKDRGGEEAVAADVYIAEVATRTITTDPAGRGPYVRGYVIARNLVAYASRNAVWDACVTLWLSRVSGGPPAPPDFNQQDFNEEDFA
jgi:hypothetical protein